MPKRRPPASPPATRLSRRWLRLTGTTLAAGIAGLLVVKLWIQPDSQAKVLQEILAEQFGGNASAIVANVPSRAGRYPGAVLAVGQNGGELLMRPAERPEALPPTKTSIRGARTAAKDVLLKLTGQAFGGELAGAGDLSIELDLSDIRIFEEPIPALAERLRRDESLARARASQQALLVVTRAFEAVPTLTIRQMSKASSTTWTKLKSDVTQFKGQQTSENTIVLKADAPEVIAYEASDARFIAGSFGNDDYRLNLVPRVQGIAGVAPRPGDVGARALGQKVAFAVIASPQYSALGFGDLPAATYSAQLVRDMLAATEAREVDTGLVPGARLTAAGFASARRRILETISAGKPDLFILYYVGHSVSGTAGATYLITGDYKGRIADDLKETSPFVPPRSATHPLAGSNIDDVAKVIAAAAQEFAISERHLISLAEVCRELDATGIPFAVLVDGCYPARAMDELREQLKFTSNGDFYGHAASPDHELREYFRALSTFGEAPYLRAQNPIVFAAKPGTFAPVLKHPYFDSDLLPGVGVLARKLFGAYSYALENREDLSAGMWLRRITDFAGTGEMDLRGSISWSDFSALQEASMVSFTTETP